jgi:hypothetical protein
MKFNFHPNEPSFNNDPVNIHKKKRIFVLNKRFHFVIEISQIFKKNSKARDGKVQSLNKKKGFFFK